MCREKHEAGMIRERYVTKVLGQSRAEIEVDRLRLIKIRIREDTLAKLGGEITFDSVLHLAVDRGRKQAIAKGNKDVLFNTWHQHVSTIDTVFGKFREILSELERQPVEYNKLLIELDNNYGTGASLYVE